MAFQRKKKNLSQDLENRRSTFLKSELKIDGATLMPYPCSQFCADIKFDIRSDNIFDIKLGDSLHVNHTINFVIKLRSYGTV